MGKKIAILFCFLIFFCSAICAGCQGETLNPDLPSALPSATPQNRYAFTVAIDAGHGGFDGGATGINTGVSESGLNLDVALKLKKKLIDNGFGVVMTRETMEAIGKDKDADMKRRKEILSAPEVDIIVSIHMNKFRDRSISGAMVFYMRGSAAGEELAKCIISQVCKAIGRPERYANPGDYFVIRGADVPAVIVECGFLSNSSDEKLLQTEDYRQILADGIAEGIMDFCT